MLLFARKGNCEEADQLMTVLCPCYVDQLNPLMGLITREVFNSDSVTVNFGWNSPSLEQDISYSVDVQPPALSSPRMIESS